MAKEFNAPVANSERLRFFEFIDSIIATAVAEITQFSAQDVTPFFARFAMNCLSALTLPKTAGKA